jgi:hypothetical protein
LPSRYSDCQLSFSLTVVVDAELHQYTSSKTDIMLHYLPSVI